MSNASSAFQHLACLLCLTALSAAPATQAEPPVAEQDAPLVQPAAAPIKSTLVDEVWRLVKDEFLDPELNGVDWDTLRLRFQAEFLAAQGAEAQSACINTMLAELKTSHTGHYTPLQVEYYDLVDVYQRFFNPETPNLGALLSALRKASLEPFQGRTDRGYAIHYAGIGIRTAQVGERTFITGVLAGLPAEQAGLEVGDELVSADGAPFHPIRSFQHKERRLVDLTIRWEEGEDRNVTVTPESIQPDEAFVKACHESAAVFARDGGKLGYIRAWSLASDQTVPVMWQQLSTGVLRDVDGLVLDLRGGWGGDPEAMLDLFVGGRPLMHWRSRDGRDWSIHQSWSRPLVALIDGGSRSAKEIVAWGLKRTGRATLVGTRTAGAVVGGKPFILSDGSLLLVAAHDLEVDGRRLEGQGVEPDVEVPFKLEYAAGRDPQLEKALEVLTEKIKKDQH